ncbi:MAG: patatin-like phospholipase family protein, partial [Candidatus Zixiibacteriota bacterium]
MKSRILIILLLAVLITRDLLAHERVVIGGLDGLDPDDTREHYAVLLALSGGGARGLATIGLLKAFEEKGIDVAAVAGVSMGGIVGGLYAAGYTPEELETLVRDINFDELFSNAPKRTSMFLTQREERERHLMSVRFDGVVPVIP